MKPWREIAVPHHDVLQGTFLQSEFAADITAVHTGKATYEYQDTSAFFHRTFITEGMALLLTSVVQRLNGNGGEPVIQLQTAFGGGKTHTMLAVYHLANRQCPLKEMPGIPNLLDQARLMDVPKARVAVLDGTARAPGQPWNHGNQKINTLWGELAWQLGGEDGFSMLRESDENGTSPGKDILKTLLEKYSPCVLLMDELVAYIRQFPNGKVLSGGSYDSNMSFIQAMTEAIKLVPTAIMLVSLPESDVEAGSQRGVATLKSLEKTFGRVQALWKPVATEEAFEIVRRRLFEPVQDTKTRDAVCRAFADAYITEGAKMPSETQESRYFNRLVQAYPIHPEVFDRLYEDWTTLQSFQRTRGVLKLMAKVIYRLWKDQNQDLMIMPGSLPLYDGGARNELIYYLTTGWDPVLEKDIDGERAETTELETKEPRFGAVQAARRVARTIFLGSAPASTATHKGIRGLDRARVVLGCFQPGQSSSTYSDALNRLADRLHYLNSSGDKTQDTTRFWFDTRANLRREMEDRKGRFDDKSDVRNKSAEILSKMLGKSTFFDAVHIFTPHGDVPDDGALRLVVLTPDKFYSKLDARLANEYVLDFVRNNGTKPRYKGNRLLFLAPEQSALARFRDCVRTVLAWKSITDDIKSKRLNIDILQQEQAEKELLSAEKVLPSIVHECYKWLLCPSQNNPSDRQPEVEAFPLSTGDKTISAEIERVCSENELVIKVWSPIHLRDILKKLYWKDGKNTAGAMKFWEDTQRYYYLPRLKTSETLERTIKEGAGSRDFFGTSHSQSGDVFEGFKFGDANVQFNDTLLLIAPEAARQYEARLTAAVAVVADPVNMNETFPALTEISNGTEPVTNPEQAIPSAPSAIRLREFHGSVDIKTATVKKDLIQLAEEIIDVLASDPKADVRITVEIGVDFPGGVSEQIKRAVSENTRSLGFRSAIWE